MKKLIAAVIIIALGMAGVTAGSIYAQTITPYEAISSVPSPVFK